MNSHKWFITALLILASALVACDAIAITPPASDLVSGVDLSQNITIDATSDAALPLTSGTLKFRYPADWFATYEAGTFTFTNVENLDLLAGAIDADQAFLGIQLFDADQAAILGADPLDPDATPSALTVLNGFTQSMTSLGQPMTFNEAEVLDENGMDMAIVVGMSAAGDAIIITRVLDEAVYMAVGATAEGVAEAFRDTFVAIVASAIVE